jgi:uncharacterized membrane protein
MNSITTVIAVLALIGSAIVGGVFFAFSSFIMKALARVSPEAGIAAMQSINVVVINPTFLGTFMGTAAISLVLAGLAVTDWGTLSSPWLLAGALFYLLGTFLVTGLGNVPLNNQLAAVSAADSSAVAVWRHYLDRWTMLNTVRTATAVAASVMLAISLL